TGGVASSNERMRIDGSGNIGIGTTSPSTKLHVYVSDPLTLTGVQTGTATSADSVLTITSGLVKKLPVSTFATPANSWSTVGNAGTTAATNFIGTTDANGFRIKGNSIQGLLVDSLGNVAVGTAPTFAAGVAREKFLVDAGTT